MKWLDYREQLGIGFHDIEKKDFFITNIFNYLSSVLKCDEKEYTSFCFMTGSSIHENIVFDTFSIGIDYSASALNILKNHKSSLNEFMSYLFALINSLEYDPEDSEKWGKEDYKRIISQELDRAGIPFNIFEDKDGIFAFPKGVEELDSALVSETLLWLSEYPDAEKAWKKALINYADANEQNASDVADLFRKALESFFKCFFMTEQSLENCKDKYGKYLKERGISKDIRNNLETLLQMYTNYNNHYAKHNDATNKSILEYILYQTGNTIRLLIMLKRQEEKS